MGKIAEKLKHLTKAQQIYRLKELPNKLIESSQIEQLHRYLTDFDFLEIKINLLGVQPLIEDYELALQSVLHISEEKKHSLRLIADAIRLAANVLSDDPTLLAGQLWGRLQSFQKPEIQAMLTQAHQQLQEYIWLRPFTSSLTPPEGALLRTLTGHLDWVQAVAITPDGKIAVSASADTTLKVWNLYTEEVALSGHKDWVNAVAISSDGRLAVSASEDRTLKVWDLPSGTEIRTLTGHKSHVSAVVITPDGQQVISASSDRTIKIWDLHSGLELRTITGYGLGEVLAITPDGQHIVSDFAKNSLRVWDLHSGSELHILKALFTAAVAITPDGRLAISASRHKTLTVWDLHSGTELRTLKGHTDFVNAVAITPDGKLAVSASSDNTLKVWDINSGTELRTFTGHYYWVWTVAITPDGRFVVSGSWDQTLIVWDLESGEEVATFNCEGELNACAISPDGVTIVAGGRSVKINFLRLEV
jgi:WD40 repeat protein